MHAPIGRPRRVRPYSVNSREIHPLRMAGFFARPNYGILGDGGTERPGRVVICQPTRFKMGGTAMKRSVTFNPDELLFIPLGGSEQFGANLNVYGFQGKWLAIDCGIGFADEYYPGVDILLPDPAFLEEHAENLAGLIITHAHEDHIGGVAHLWPRFKCPIFFAIV